VAVEGEKKKMKCGQRSCKVGRGEEDDVDEKL